MNIKKHIPNAITCCNLLCGCAATGFAFGCEFDAAFFLIILGAIFDFFDGFAARLLHVSSPIGKELDSLADVITFGFAPAAITFMLIDVPIDVMQWKIVSFAAFLIAAFSALRLAKFNIDERQTYGFIGLPTPANALFWGSLGILLPAINYPDWFTFEILVPLLLLGVFISCWLLVSEVPMFALKFKNYGWRGNELRYSFIAVSALLLAVLGLGGFSAVIVLYVVLSVLTQRRG